jgi:hypothetical protein
VQELTELQRQRMSIQGISKLTGWDSKTIRKYLVQPNTMPEYGPRRRTVSKLDPFQVISGRKDARRGVERAGAKKTGNIIRIGFGRTCQLRLQAFVSWLIDTWPVEQGSR